MSRRDQSPNTPFSWPAFFSALASFALLVGLLGLLVGAIVGMRPLERYVAQLPGVKATQVVVRWPTVRPPDGGEPVTWVPQPERQALEELAAAALAGDVDRFSADPIDRVGRAMGSSGWFTGQPRVRRAPGGIVEVDGLWRTPAAVVRQQGVDQLISWDGFPMPVTATAGSTRFPVIEGAAVPAPKGPMGTVDYASAWPGEDIAASLELLGLALRQPWAGQVAGVDLSRFPSERSLILLTTQGTRVVWGGRASRPALGEVSTEQKLAHLTELYTRSRRIDAGFPMIYVNTAKLQFDISATAQALAARAGEAVEVPEPRSLPR